MKNDLTQYSYIVDDDEVSIIVANRNTLWKNFESLKIFILIQNDADDFRAS